MIISSICPRCGKPVLPRGAAFDYPVEQIGHLEQYCIGHESGVSHQLEPRRLERVMRAVDAILKEARKP